MTVKDYALQVDRSPRSIQRHIDKYNSTFGTSFPTGVNEPMPDDADLLHYIAGRLSHKNADSKPAVPPSDGKSRNKHTPPQKRRNALRGQKKGVFSLRVFLSKDWIAMLTVSVILLADVFAFYLVASNKWSGYGAIVHYVFGLIGFATGTGAIRTYLSIDDEKWADGWKYAFTVMQVLVLGFAMNDYWTAAEAVMVLMFGSVFVGIQKSIKFK